MSRRPPSSRRPETEYGVLVFAGLAGIAKKELGTRGFEKARTFSLRNYDLVLFRAADSRAAHLAGLRLGEDCFYLMGDPVRVERQGDVERLRGVVTREGMLRGLEVKNRLFQPRKPKQTTYNCFVKQDQDREVHRKYIADRVCSLIGSHFSRWKRADPATVEIWGFYLDMNLHLGLRLSDHRMRYREGDPVLRGGALRPTIAAALACVAAPQPGELVIDPMCGTGTILIETLARNGQATYLGGDIDGEAVAIGTRRSAGKGVQLQEWDARELPLVDRSVDCILCNLPFGKQYSSAEANAALYPALMKSWLTKLKPGGRMVLLTSDSQNLERSLSACGLIWWVAGEVKVLGEWARIYRAAKGT